MEKKPVIGGEAKVDAHSEKFLQEEAQHRIRVQNDITAAQRALMTRGAVDLATVRLACKYLEPSRYLEVEEERSLSGGVCGFVLCGNPHKSGSKGQNDSTDGEGEVHAFGARPDKKKFRISIKERRVEEALLQDYYCSVACRKRSEALTKTISTESPIVRILPGRFKEQHEALRERQAQAAEKEIREQPATDVRDTVVLQDTSALNAVARDLAAVGVREKEVKEAKIVVTEEVRPPSTFYPSVGGSKKKKGGADGAEDRIHSEFFLEEECARYPVQLAEHWSKRETAEQNEEARMIELALLNNETEDDFYSSDEDDVEAPPPKLSDFALVYQFLMDLCSTRTKRILAGQREAVAATPARLQLGARPQRLEALATRLKANVALAATLIELAPSTLQEAIADLLGAFEYPTAIPNFSGKQQWTVTVVLLTLVQKTSPSLESAFASHPSVLPSLMLRCQLRGSELSALLRVFQ